MVRLIALDIDGTLLRSDKTVSARTRDALARARARGVHLVLVTGRRYPSARKVADDLGGVLPLVLHNGALVMEDGRVLRSRLLARETARRAISIGREMGCEPVLHCGARGEGLLFVDADAPRSGLVGYYLERSASDVRSVPAIEDALPEVEPVQVMFGGGHDAMTTLRQRLESALGTSARVERTVYPASGLTLLDVIDPGVGKAEALAFLQGRICVAASETLAIGDNWNDREMIAAAGLGFVMGNADVELQRLGLPVLPSNDEDGVAIAIERHVLTGAVPVSRP